MRRLLVPALVIIVISCFLALLLYDVQKAGSAPALNPVNGDMYTQFVPLLNFARGSVLEGSSFPLWNPYEAVGRPFFADIGVGLLYPINWAIFLLDVPLAMLVIQFLNVAIGMVGTLLYMRYLKLDWPAVILAMVLFGYAVFLDTFVPNKGATLCWLPLIMLLTHRLFDKPGFGSCLALAASLLFCFLGGFANYFYYICIIGFVYFSFVIVFSWPEYKLKGTLVRLSLVGLAFVLMLGIVSVQLLPTLELSLSSGRNVAGKYAVSEADSPFMSFSMSLMFRNYLNRTSANLWGVRNLGVPFAAYYFGSALLFVPFSIASRKNRPLVIALFAAMGYTVLFVLSKRVPALALLGQLPFSDSLRWHARMIDLNQFMLGILAGIGLLVLWERGSVRLRDTQTGKLNWFPILAALYTLVVAYPICKTVVRLLFRSHGYFVILLPWLVIGAVFLIYASGYPSRMKGFLAGTVLLVVLLGFVRLSDIIYAVIDLIIILLCIPLVPLVFLYSSDSAPRMKRFVGGMAVVLVPLGILLRDKFEPTGYFILIMTAVFVFFFCDSGFPSWTRRVGAWVVMLLLLVDIVSYRHIRCTVPATTNISDNRSLYTQRIDWIKQAAKYNRVFTRFANPVNHTIYGSAFQLFIVNSYKSLTLARWGNFVYSIYGFEEPEKMPPFYGIFPVFFTDPCLREARMMGLASLQYAVMDFPIGEEKCQGVWENRREYDSDPKFYVYENTFAVPRAYLVNGYKITRDERESLRAIRDNVSSLSHSVILENGEPSFPSADVSANPGRARIERYEINEVELHVEADEPSLLVLTDSYYPGWNAFVDGVRTPIWRANSLFRAVETPAGSHTVVFKYQPSSLRWGASISLGTLLVILIVLFIRRHRAGRRLTDADSGCRIHSE